jgi:hypothetical protein
MYLLNNQSMVGFDAYYDSSGIKAISMIYADIIDPPPSSPPREEGRMLSFLWGFLFMSGLCSIVTAVIIYKRRLRHKAKFRAYDTILPLK